MAEFYKDFNKQNADLLSKSLGGEGFSAELSTPHINVAANASIKDATSNLSSKLSYQVNDNVATSFTIKTPHHYNVNLVTDLKDRFKDTGAKLTGLKITADLDCDEQTHTYPTTFHSHLQFNNLVGVHAQVMTEKGNNLEAQFDLFARVYRGLHAGGEVIYDDKAKTLILSKYGLFWRAHEQFNLALEYAQVGDQNTINASTFHSANPNTTVGSQFVYDLKTSKIGVTSAVQHKLDESTTLKARVDNLGTLDFAVSGRLSEHVQATFSTGLNASGVFHGKTHDESYAGVQFNFVL